jgi:hypothetical protein
VRHDRRAGGETLGNPLVRQRTDALVGDQLSRRHRQATSAVVGIYLGGH